MHLQEQSIVVRHLHQICSSRQWGQELVKPDAPRIQLADLLPELLVVCSICHASGVRVVGLEVLVGACCTVQMTLLDSHWDHSCVATESDDFDSHAAAEQKDMVEGDLLGRESVSVVR
jgi:hypothetical protein